jgi:hypothetical protein
MAKLTECVIGVELASAIRRVINETGSKMPRSKLAFRCPECRRPVRPHVSAEGKLESHFEHFKRNPNCHFGNA